VIDGRTGSVQVVFARSQRQANAMALAHFRADSTVVCA